MKAAKLQKEHIDAHILAAVYDIYSVIRSILYEVGRVIHEIEIGRH